MVEEEHHLQCRMSIENNTEIEQLKESDKNQWSAINSLRNRLPVWATLAFSILTFLFGTVVGALYFALNYLPR